MSGIEVIAGLALGAAPILVQLLHGCVQGYQYYAAAVDIKEDCRYLQALLRMEYARLLDWASVSGITHFEDGDDLPVFLRSHRLVILAIFTEIQERQKELATLCGKYEELKTDWTAGTSDAELANLKTKATEIFQPFMGPENRESEQTSKTKFARFKKKLSNAKSVFTNPKRIKWVTLDKDQFEGLLSKLAKLNDGLQNLLGGHQLQVLNETTRKTYMEMVQFRNDLKDLQHLVQAALALDKSDFLKPTDSRFSPRNRALLEFLASFKGLHTANDALLTNGSSQYYHSSNVTPLPGRIFYTAWTNHLIMEGIRKRTTGTYTTVEGIKHKIWIEWKPYLARYSASKAKDLPIDAHTQRIRELVSLLQFPKPDDFGTPQCIGFFDDGDNKKTKPLNFHFGLVFKLQDEIDLSSPPISLRQILENATPSLTDRISLAAKLATSIMYLHAVNWLHKSLDSDSIVFFNKAGQPDLTKSFLTGFEFARPDRDGETTRSAPRTKRNDLYSHPQYQGPNAVGTYRKTFDIYSLGIVLSEIVYWQSIEDIVGIADVDEATSADILKIRDTVLGDPAFFQTINSQAGSIVCEAVRSCILGGEAFGLSEGQPEGTVEAGVMIQRRFSELVVNRLTSLFI
ncbi:hypothetical protein MMC11_007592 [Xylographa trunciseda]|nr:hypothetical protein [Xylographa trunciseda]